MKQLVIIQSRMDSSRLPGKAMLMIQEKPSLWHVIRRCLESGVRVVVATTNRSVDDEIEAISETLDVDCYRFPGDKDDVLGRFVWVAEQEKLKTGNSQIVRVTADCLGIEGRTIKEVLENLYTDYAYANPDHGYPNGTGCEAFTLRALKEANRRADSKYDREHVTPYIQRAFKWSTWKVRRYDDFDMELNTEEDLERIRNIYAYRN